MNARVPIEGARLLKLNEAAAYCGIPARGFRKSVPVMPVRLGPHELWDKNALDAFIDGLQGKKPGQQDKDWADAVARF